MFPTNSTHLLFIFLISWTGANADNIGSVTKCNVCMARVNAVLYRANNNIGREQARTNVSGFLTPFAS